MRIGMMIGEGAGESPTLDEIIQRAQRIEAAGLSSGWMANIFAYHVVPRITTAAREAGNVAPRVIAGMPISLANDITKAREVATKVFAIYRDLPAYRTMLDRGGAAEPVDVAFVGDPATVKGELKRLEDIGVTDLCAFVFHAEPGAFERTVDFLGSL